jgi:hypothetical protein
MNLLRVAVLFLFFLSSVYCDDGARGYLLIHQSVDNNLDIAQLYAVHHPITVNVTVYNIGEGSAYSVSVNDEWPASFIVSGSNKAEISEIAANSSKSFNFTVTPTVEGEVEDVRAAVEYQPILDGPVMSAYSTAADNVTVVSDEIYKKFTEKHELEWTIFVVVFLGAVLAPLAPWLQIQLNYEHGLPKAAFHTKSE